MPADEYHRRDNKTAESVPLWYIFNQQGRNRITFSPVPSEAFSLVVDDDDLWGPAIEDHIIVEYYQLPGTDNPIPEYIKRRLVKYYVLKSCFALEGKGQKLKAAAKFEARYQFYLNVFKGIYAGTFVAKNPTLGGQKRVSVVAPPILPYTYGQGVDF